MGGWRLPPDDRYKYVKLEDAKMSYGPKLPPRYFRLGSVEVEGISTPLMTPNEPIQGPETRRPGRKPPR